MAKIPATGAVSLEMISDEFGGGAPDSISDYYADDGIPTGWIGVVPFSGEISLEDFRNTFDHFSSNEPALVVGNVSGLILGYTVGSMGSLSNATVVSGAVIREFNYNALVPPIGANKFVLEGTGEPDTSASFTEIYVNGTYLRRSDATYNSNEAGNTSWTWSAANRIFPASGTLYPVIR